MKYQIGFSVMDHLKILLIYNFKKFQVNQTFQEHETNIRTGPRYQQYWMGID